jgi:hypothetical protein
VASIEGLADWTAVTEIGIEKGTVSARKTEHRDYESMILYKIQTIRFFVYYHTIISHCQKKKKR